MRERERETDRKTGREKERNSQEVKIFMEMIENSEEIF